MTAAAPLSEVSPDGRFELRVETWHDRAALEGDTFLVERASNRVLLSIGDAQRSRFGADGLLLVDRPRWSAVPVHVDPLREVFRQREDDPWLPLAAWRVAVSGFHRGWEQALEVPQREADSVFPWIEIGIALAAAISTTFFAWQPWIQRLPQVVLLAISALTLILFVHLSGSALQRWRARGRTRTLPR